MNLGIDPPDLVGRWSLRRRLVDRRAGLYGAATGTLTIGVDHSWAEAGTLRFGDHRAPFTRRLRFASVDGEWWLTFADGTLFHPWRPGAPVEHPCRADLYRGRVTVSPDGRRLRVLWDVSGPVKDQRIVTDFRRLP